MFSGRKDLRYLALAVFVVLFGLFNSGLDDQIADKMPRPQSSVWMEPIDRLAFHYRRETREERFYHCFGQMALGREHDRDFLEEHRGDLGEYEPGMLGPDLTTGPILPYRDYIAEYPPVNFPLIAGPSLLAEKDFRYAQIFRLMLASLVGCSFLLCLHLAGRLGLSGGERRRFVMLALAGTLLLGPIMVTRLDGITLFCLMGGLVFVSHQRPLGAGLMFGLATGAKIVPLFLIPFVFLHWWLGAQKGRALRFAFASSATIALVFVPAFLSGPDNFRAMFRFHGERPIQAESTFALLMRIQELLFGTEVKLIHSFGSWNLDGPFADLFKSLSTPLALGTVAIMLFLYRGWLVNAPDADRPTRESWLLRAIGATVAGLMAFSKGFSPQYLIWTWPWLFLSERARKPFYDVLCLLVLFWTQLITHEYGSAVVKGEFAGTALLAGRNFILVGLLFWLARRPSGESEEESPSAEDWGKKTAVVPLILALLSAAVCLQSRHLEASWMRETPRNETPGFNLVDFSAAPTGDITTRKGYNGLEQDKEGNTYDWTAKREVIHYFPIDRSELPLILEFRALNALNPDFQTGIQAQFNDRKLELWSSEGRWPRVFSAWVPREKSHPGPWSRLVLTTPEPVSPRDLGVGPDFRMLGLQMDWVSLSVVDGFVRLYSPSPGEVLESFAKDEMWVMRARFPEGPPSEDWEQVDEEFWEATFEVDKMPVGGAVWLYRPGDFFSDLARFPVGSGWSSSSSDLVDRPFRKLAAEGHLSIRFPKGKYKMSLTVLKEDKLNSGSVLELSIEEGRELALESTELDWSTRYETEIETDAGLVHFLLRNTGPAGNDVAVGSLEVRRLSR